MSDDPQQWLNARVLRIQTPEGGDHLALPTDHGTIEDDYGVERTLEGMIELSTQGATITVLVDADGKVPGLE